MVESVKNRVVTNKTVVQRTTNTNAVQVNKYDAAGNLKSSDIDSTSWEDRDTQSYQWSNREQPPSEALAPPPTDDRIEQFFAAAEQQQQQDDQGTDGNRSALVLTTAERRDVPAVTWTGSSATHQVRCYIIAARFYASAAMPACGVCPSVCPSATFIHSVKTNKHIFKILHRWVATPF